MQPYFHRFEKRQAPDFPPMSARRTMAWQFLAGMTIGVSLWYLHWRWSVSLNPDAMIFSCLVAGAETLFFIGSAIFFHDIWREEDTPRQPPPTCRSKFGTAYDVGATTVDVFITTFNEDANVVRPSVLAALAMIPPTNVIVKIWILDDGNREEFSRLADEHEVGYLRRADNRGFKAGNLKNALLQTDGDFVVICDADTRIFPNFLINTLGYFRDANTAWVQTPHWFYDIPEGQLWVDWVAQKLSRILPPVAQKYAGRVLQFASGQSQVGADPMLSEPALFFDVIQRRRNRNGASFCCGAGSIHRREALFQSALFSFGRILTSQSNSVYAHDFEPFKFHVSEDIYTSIQLHSDPTHHWTSVYHPHVECRMLSPWTMEAWATQKLKYAGGTFDIMLNDNPIFRRGMPWRIKAHYLATFWSYLSVLWAPIMMLAPVLSLFSGWSPVKAYSLEFFMHILPVLLLSELAMVVGCKGHNINIGRIMAVGGMPITLRALVQVLRGRKPRFPTTPKTPVFSDVRFDRVRVNIAILAVMGTSVCYGFWAYLTQIDGYSLSFLIVNVFWIAWNAFGHLRIVAIAAWRPPESALQKGTLPEQIPTSNAGVNNAPI